MKLKRRFVGCAAGTPATGTTAMAWPWRRHPVSHWRPRSSIAVLESHDYSDRLEALLLDGLRLFRLKLAGKSVLLKPNLVEDLPGPVNTDAMLIGAAARCFLRLGASTVVIGEGPGHQRDTELVVWSAGLRPHLSDRQIRFVDLNRDELTKVKLQTRYSGLGELWLPRTVLESDFVVSMPKVKTHHWAGVTLSLKNMFGIVPGMKYGWPKNLLALARHSRKHSRHLRDRAHPLRHCRWHCGDGRRRPPSRRRTGTPPGRPGGRPRSSGCHVRSPDGIGPASRETHRGR